MQALCAAVVSEIELAAAVLFTANYFENLLKLQFSRFTSFSIWCWRAQQFHLKLSIIITWVLNALIIYQEVFCECRISALQFQVKSMLNEWIIRNFIFTEFPIFYRRSFHWMTSICEEYVALRKRDSVETLQSRHIVLINKSW